MAKLIGSIRVSVRQQSTDRQKAKLIRADASGEMISTSIIGCLAMAAQKVHHQRALFPRTYSPRTHRLWKGRAAAAPTRP